MSIRRQIKKRFHVQEDIPTFLTQPPPEATPIPGEARQFQQQQLHYQPPSSRQTRSTNAPSLPHAVAATRSPTITLPVILQSITLILVCNVMLYVLFHFYEAPAPTILQQQQRPMLEPLALTPHHLEQRVTTYANPQQSPRSTEPIRLATPVQPH